MLSQTTLFALAALSTLTSAITVTNPNRQTIWDSGKSNTITWSKVSTDPSSFDIYLSHMVGGSAPLNALLFSDVSSDKGSVVVEGLQLPTGDAYQINFVAHNKPEQIYAQSNQFNVTGEAVKATSTVEGYTGSTYTSKVSSGASASDDKTTAKDTTLVTSTTASSKATETSSTKTETDSSASSETTGTSGTAANAEATQTESGTASKASLSATATPNAAVGNVATGSLAAFVFGAIALFA